MRILFVHQNFPGQYRHLVRHCAAIPGCEVACIGESANLVHWEGIKGVRLHGTATPQGANTKTHPYIQGFEGHVRRGQTVARTALEIKKSGFEPDIICVHTGWGEGLYLKDVFPDAKVLSFCEFYYNAVGSDVDFENTEPLSLDKRLLTRTRNSTQLLSMADSDWGISPTEWQRSLYPSMVKERISVIHDGIDTDAIRPNHQAHGTLANTGLPLKAGDEVITFVSRNLEPYRGFHIFVQSLPLIQKMRPNARIVVIGSDGVSYGKPAPKGTTYREMFMKEVQDKVDLSKIHFLGRIPHSQFVTILQISAVHVYLTYPFVLSWSMLEAMSAGCAVVGSKTPPVEEVIQHGHNGLLVDFFSPGAVAEAVQKVLTHPTRMQEMRDAARRTVVENYDLRTICLPKQMHLIQALARGEKPSLTQ